MTRTRQRREAILVIPVEVDDGENGRPGVGDIIEVPPEVAVLGNGGVVGVVPWSREVRVDPLG